MTINPFEPQELDWDGERAQAERARSLAWAEWPLIIMGVLIILIHLFLLFNLPNEVRREGQKLVQDASARHQYVTNLSQVESLMYKFCIVFYGGTAILGFVYTGSGCLLRYAPLTISISTLALFLLHQLILVALAIFTLTPLLFCNGWLFKI